MDKVSDFHDGINSDLAKLRETSALMMARQVMGRTATNEETLDHLIAWTQTVEEIVAKLGHIADETASQLARTNAVVVEVVAVVQRIVDARG